MGYKLLKIDDLTRDDHYYLSKKDQCYYLMEYTPGASFTDNRPNSLISNLKKKPDRKGKPDWKYKGRAIKDVANIFLEAIKKNILTSHTIIPIPPSKHKNDPMYDDRMTQILQAMKESVVDMDVRELLFLKANITTSHETGDRPPPSYFQNNIYIDKKLIKPVPKKILLFDDMITAGSHFKGCQGLLQSEFGDIEIRGIFIARRVLANEKE